jgi:hypothetical protein
MTPYPHSQHRRSGQSGVIGAVRQEVSGDRAGFRVGSGGEWPVVGVYVLSMCTKAAPALTSCTAEVSG